MVHIASQDAVCERITFTFHFPIPIQEKVTVLKIGRASCRERV